ncbi:unnamed protein product [Lactuca saligna]|uniref:Uncharacterized protein n=1 Tax=Lactuca saligna TaxID=75948 RepID=A0AA36EJX2_LACSI|nr:unnamed protein product [Lactuca saligna]
MPSTLPYLQHRSKGKEKSGVKHSGYVNSTDLRADQDRETEKASSKSPWFAIQSKVKKKTNIIEMQKKEMEEVRVNAATAIFLCFLILTSSQRLCSDMVQNPNVNYNVVTLSTVLLACATISTLILAMHFHGWVCRKRSIYIRNNNTNIEQKW